MNAPTLTIRQPWAWAICAGHKTVENRTWPTRHRGLVLVHVSQRRPGGDDLAVLASREIETPDEFDGFGRVVGWMIVTGCEPTSNDEWWIPGNWAWAISDAGLLTRPGPVVRGAAGHLFQSPIPPGVPRRLITPTLLEQ